MGMLDHWHPVFPSKKLKERPMEVTLANQMICLFRKSDGSVGAVDNVCPHRRLKLSYGRVVNDKIECRYHGWQFDCDGQGESPGTPKLHTCTTSFATREAWGYVWVKSKESAPQFPEINADGYFHVGNLQHTIPAPLELSVDNFNEIEHSGTVHDTFGYDLDQMDKVEVRFETTDETVRVINTGPTKKIAKPISWLVGIRPGDIFHDDWTTHFSPVYSVFDHWWTSPDGTRESRVRWRIFIFFWPNDDQTTTASSLVFAKSRYPGPSGGLRLFRRFMLHEVNKEIMNDVSMLHFMADKSVDIDGMKLSRFDKVLGLTRERINRIYRGEKPSRTPLSV